MEPKKIYLKDYQAPTHQILSTELWFELYEDFCRVTQKSRMKWNPVAQNTTGELWLDGEELSLQSIKINGHHVEPDLYDVNLQGLKILETPHEFDLEIETRLEPQTNTSLAGLYRSNGVYCTQCEAEGFRRITYFLDRPDVMTSYTVHIEADKTKYPILLSNGDRISQKDLTHGRHQVSWKDPFKKPCYLFALVAGDLGVLKDHFVTMSGKTVSLEIYSPHGTQDRCTHAMESLQKSMKWDELRYGREYDLSTFMILAVDDFNMGAMENKGLNVFNSRLVFANPKTATDSDYFDIESVVGHEYFHNWTGNRVTVRDWFHLSLKEGLTVFRDQEFSMDMSSRDMVRIEGVSFLRSGQFAEDAGPNSHPIRPESCYAVDNFYTKTIYEKGAEVIRMMQTMVGRPGFRKGMDLYFERFDGQAVIIEDFAKAISDANNQDWEQFKLWYSQAGTPTVRVLESYSLDSKTYKLTLLQTCKEGQQAFHIPLVIGLLDANGKELPLPLSSTLTQNTENQYVLHLKSSTQTWEFANIAERPVLSINRQFSAPVHLQSETSPKDLLFLIEKDQDSFNRWESAQKIEIQEFRKLIENPKANVDAAFLGAIQTTLLEEPLPEDLRSLFLQLPEDQYLTQMIRPFNAGKLLAARESFEHQMSIALEKTLVSLYEKYHGKNSLSKDPKEFGRRRLKNKALGLLAAQSKYHDLVYKQFSEAQIMTDEEAALELLVDLDSPLREKGISAFYDKWKSEFLVMNKWFQAQALSRHPDTFKNVVHLSAHPDFNIKNPNRVYSLLLKFGNNLVRFHDASQDTYSFMADKIIEIDKLNPQVATRVAGSFDFWKSLEFPQKQKAHREIERMIRAGLSKNTYEIVSKQLAE